MADLSQSIFAEGWVGALKGAKVDAVLPIWKEIPNYLEAAVAGGTEGHSEVASAEVPVVADQAVEVKVADLPADNELGVQSAAISKVAVVEESSEVLPAADVEMAETVEAVVKPIEEIAP